MVCTQKKRTSHHAWGKKTVAGRRKKVGEVGGTSQNHGYHMFVEEKLFAIPTEKKKKKGTRGRG